MLPALLKRDPSPSPVSMAPIEPSHVLTTILTAIPLLLYTFILVRRFDSKVWAAGFNYTNPLKRWEFAGFLVVYAIEALVLMLTASTLIQWGARRWKRKLVWLSSVPVMAAYFIYITAKFRIMRSLKDGIDLVVLRSLGGGSLLAALNFVRADLLSFVPLILISLLVGAGGGWFLKRYGRGAAIRLDTQWLVRTALGTKGLIVANAALVILAPVIALASFPLHNALSAYLPHALYSVPALYLTDFDGDGYGLMDSPPDFAPFDRSRHPYAVETAGNGVDADGVGGDLPVAVFKAPMGSWDGTRLERKNVLLITLESARAELLTASFKGSPVMPALQSLPGQTINVVSNAGRTGPSVSGMFAGTLSEFESGISLVDRFRELNYRTAIISAQKETFGNIDRHARMNHADLFVDSTGFPFDQRMFANYDDTLRMASDLITARFAQWLRASDAGKPFFAYLNFQEMHFPYHYPGAHSELTARPIPVREMFPENKEWLRETYFDAARRADAAIGTVISALDELHILEDTVILVVGDHGEELFDNGYLGHGVSLSYDSYATVGKLVNSGWKAPAGPIGISDVSTIFYNSLVRAPAGALPLDQEVLCYVGYADKPPQVGLATPAGLTRYDFRTNAWTRQAHWGAPILPAAPDNHVIHVWESYLIKRIQGAGGAHQPDVTSLREGTPQTR